MTPKSLDIQKQAMLYVDFDVESGSAISPRKYVDHQQIKNEPLIEEVEWLVRYVALNKSSQVFNLEALSAYRRLNEIAEDEHDRLDLTHLFYHFVLRRPAGLAGAEVLGEVMERVRDRHPMDAEALVVWLSEVGNSIGT
jgi:hypothetical protein